jgi:uncharacterized membrane protein YuzA (DUF378 family)
MMNKLSGLDWVALVLVIIGGLNWGLVGVFNIDVIAEVFGMMTTISQIVYVLVGLSAIYLAIIAKKLGKQ